MMDYPLTVQSIYQRARTLFPDRQLVTRRPEGSGGEVRRTTYGHWADRVARLAGGLRELGVGPGDRVATFCWNHDRHLEVYFAAALMGASYHTLNIRLGGDQLAYIVNHARDKVLVCDAELAQTIGPVLPNLDTVRHVLVLDADDGERPSLGFGSEHGYEDLVERSAPPADWPELDEWQTAGICYTSATTGHPKGVAYSHRALYLHSLMLGSVDTAAISERDVLLPIVPMFHVNAWGMPFAATWYGAGQVYGGPAPTPADYLRLIREEGVTVSAGFARRPICTILGDRWNWWVNCSISRESEAENMSVWRFCGSAFTIRRIGGRKPMSNIRSASSSTRNSMPERLATRWSIRSINRPGVATTRSTPERNASICGRSLTPPKTVAMRNGTCFA